MVLLLYAIVPCLAAYIVLVSLISLVGHVICLKGLLAAAFESSEQLHLLGLNGRVSVIPS